MCSYYTTHSKYRTWWNIPVHTQRANHWTRHRASDMLAGFHLKLLSSWSKSSLMNFRCIFVCFTCAAVTSPSTAAWETAVFYVQNIRGNTAHKANQCLHNDDKPESQYLVFFFNMWTLNSIRQVFSKQLSGIVTRKHSGRTPGQLLLTCFLRAFKKVEGSCVSFCVLVCLWSWPHAAVLPLNSSPHI